MAANGASRRAAIQATKVYRVVLFIAGLGFGAGISNCATFGSQATHRSPIRERGTCPNRFFSMAS